MLTNLKALVVVLAIAAAIFRLAKPIALRFMSAEDYSLRRRVWLALSIVGFVSPSFWLYALVAVPVLIWAGRNDTNPPALYLLLLHVVPPVGVIIPILGNNGLFPLDNYRLLALCVLWPAVARYRKDKENAARTFSASDVLVLALGALDVVLYTAPDLPNHVLIPDSVSNALRRGVLFFLDSYLLYYAMSRLCRSRGAIVDATACFCLACALMAAIAIFEQLKGWLLYAELAHGWAPDAGVGSYLARGNLLRAQASAGHALALGCLLAIASGFWLYLKSRVPSRAYRVGFTILLWGGLFATSSRGPWLGAVVIYFAFNAIGPRAASRMLKGVSLGAAVAGLIALSPIGDRIVDMLPLKSGNADFNILYRQRLADRGWELVLEHPFFGNQFPWPAMEDLRQGQGIIDLVNTYLQFALGYGLIGLFFFLSFILLGTIKAYVRARSLARSDPDLALLGISFAACVAGFLVMIQSNSFDLGNAKMFYVLGGLAVAYARLPRLAQKPGDAVLSSKAPG